jgi:hypothetical protein
MESYINISSSKIFEDSSLFRGTRMNLLEQSRSLAVTNGKLCDLVTIMKYVYSLPILFIIADMFVRVTVEMFSVLYCLLVFYQNNWNFYYCTSLFLVFT